MFSEKGEIAEGKRNPTLFPGTMQKMQRTVTLCGVLSANQNDNEAMDTLRVHGFLYNVPAPDRKRERKRE